MDYRVCKLLLDKTGYRYDDPYRYIQLHLLKTGCKNKLPVLCSMCAIIPVCFSSSLRPAVLPPFSLAPIVKASEKRETSFFSCRQVSASKRTRADTRSSRHACACERASELTSATATSTKQAEGTKASPLASLRCCDVCCCQPTVRTRRAPFVRGGRFVSWSPRAFCGRVFAWCNNPWRNGTIDAIRGMRLAWGRQRGLDVVAHITTCVVDKLFFLLRRPLCVSVCPPCVCVSV